MKKILQYSIIIALANFGCQNNNTKSEEKAEKTAIVGNDVDKNGCKSSAGYNWSVLKNKCIRIFEEGIRLDPKEEKNSPTVSAFAIIDGDKAEIFLVDLNGSIILNKLNTDSWSNDSLKLLQTKETLSLEKNKKVIYEGEILRK